MSQINNSFDKACSFLYSRTPSNNFQIEGKVELMQQYVGELNANAPTLSQQRKNDLRERVGALYDEIEKIAFPPAPPTLQEAYDQQVGSLKNLIQELEHLSPLEFHKKLKKLHPNIKRKIYEIVWIASDCPKKTNFSEWSLKQDPSILKKEFPSFTGSGSGTLLQQVLADLFCDLQLSQNHPDSPILIKSRLEFFEACLAENRNSHNHMKAVFECMPHAVKAALNAKGINPPFYGRGINFEAYRTYGAHYNGYSGWTSFKVYAPNARKIVLNLTAFGNTEHSIEMQREADGNWIAHTDQAEPGRRTYHFMVTGRDGGNPVKKVDPFAFASIIHDLDGKRENHESVVVDIDKEYQWTDGVWMGNRKNHDFAKQPLTIYEVHSLSWKVDHEGKPLNWRVLAPQLSAYCKDHYYNGVELMALFSHPQPISMGYQITNFFAPHPEMGTWEDFQSFVDHMHNQGISVFADWVPAHFALDEFGLGNFDGSSYYGDDNPTFAFTQWGSRVFDFSKKATNDFLASNACFILDKLHIDGLRVDAVTHMLRMNWVKPEDRPERYNRKGTDVDLHAQLFFRHLHTHIHKKFPGAISMAEDACGFANLTRPTQQKGKDTQRYGVGFDFTWHMGFMHDTLEKGYWKMNFAMRSKHFSLLTGTAKAIDYNEDSRPRGKVVIPYSHDECANGKGSILYKMAGDNRHEKFANGRLALAYQLLRGGGPILDLMGNENLQSHEWHGYIKPNAEKKPGEKPRASMQWEELDPKVDVNEHHLHTGAALSRRDLNALFHKSPGLWDQTDNGFSFIDATDAVNCVMSFHRRGGGQQFACIINSGGNDLPNYRIRLPDRSYAPELAKLTGAKEVYNTDDARYGGKGRTNRAIKIVLDGSGQPKEIELRLPPYTAIVLEEAFC